MNKKSYKSYFIISIVCFFLFFFLLLLLFVLDKSDSGLYGTIIGLTNINVWFKTHLLYNNLFYEISDILGLFIILVIITEVALGAFQLFKRKSFLKVDKNIIILGILYIIILLIYLFFNYVLPVNFRPVDIGDGLESSFPSSHTLFSIFTFCTLCFLVDFYFKEKASTIIKIISILLMILIIAFRMLSGVHWITDIVAGVILGLAFAFLYKGLIVKYSIK